MDVSKGVIGIWNSQPRDKSPYKKISGSQATESGQQECKALSGEAQGSDHKT